MKDGVANNGERLDNYCRENGFEKWFDTSAKENVNIETAIQYLVSLVGDCFSSFEFSRNYF